MRLPFNGSRSDDAEGMRRYALTQRWDQQHLRTTRRLLDPKPGARILEVGSGRGFLTRSLEELGAIATGIDANPSAAAHAVARDIRVMHVDSLAFVDAEFDHVLAIHAIEHFPNLDRAFGEMARVLRPGGTMLLTYPYEPIRGLTAVPDAITIYRNPFRARDLHVHALRPRRVRELGARAGLDHVLSEFRVFPPQFTTVLRRAAPAPD